VAESIPLQEMCELAAKIIKPEGDAFAGNAVAPTDRGKKREKGEGQESSGILQPTTHLY